MREDVRYLIEEYGPSERHACALVGIAVMSYRYRPRRRDADLRARLMELARRNRASATGGCTCCSAGMALQ